MKTYAHDIDNKEDIGHLITGFLDKIGQSARSTTSEEDTPCNISKGGNNPCRFMDNPIMPEINRVLTIDATSNTHSNTCYTLRAGV